MSKKESKSKSKEEVQDKNVQEETVATENVDAVKEEQVEEKKELSPEQIIEQLNDKYLRLYSEFENFRKRTQKEKADIIKSAGGDVIKDLLPVLDDFDRAIDANKKVEDPKALKEGFDLIFNKLKSNLSGKGLKEIESTNEDFDTEYHEAITEFPAPSDDMKGKVIDTAEKGYLLNGKVLRFAKVVVGK